MKKQLHLCIGFLLVMLLCLPANGFAADQTDGINIGGAVRFQYNYRDWVTTSQDKVGDMTFDTFRLDMNGEIGKMILSAEYRWYEGWNSLHHGWIGYNFNSHWQGQVGLNKVPFGILPFASHNFWFSGAYYLGFEDNYDMGAKTIYDNGPLNVQMAFYKNADLGSPGDAGRYSVDVLYGNAGTNYGGTQTTATNEKTNQGNLRVAYTFSPSDTCSTEIGASYQYGGLYNKMIGKTGYHWASAVHLNGNYGRWNIQLEGIHYEFYPKDQAGISPEIINMGAYNGVWGAPARADIGIANISYGLPVAWGPITKLTFYSDNTAIKPKNHQWNTIWQNVVGTMVTAGPVYVYVDLISAENMIFMGGDMVSTADINHNQRQTRLNINFGYYF